MPSQLVVVDIEGTPVQVFADLAAVDWDQARRFRDLCGRFGYWGLALLEAILRQSDHAVSAQLSQDRPVEVA